MTKYPIEKGPLFKAISGYDILVFGGDKKSENLMKKVSVKYIVT